MEKEVIGYNVYKGHTLDEYNKKYVSYKNLRKVKKTDADKTKHC